MIQNQSVWRTRLSLKPGQKGTLRMYELYGKDLFCVRYRYDGKGFRITTVEIVVDKAKVAKREMP